MSRLISFQAERPDEVNTASRHQRPHFTFQTPCANHCMPPRKPASKSKPPPGPATPSKRTDLIPVGSRQVQVKHPSRLDENGLLPSTARALVLRNGKQGAMGTGELMSLRKPIGREKLELLGGKPLSNGLTMIEYPASLVQKRTSLQSRPKTPLPHRLTSTGSSARQMRNIVVRTVLLPSPRPQDSSRLRSDSSCR